MKLLARSLTLAALLGIASVANAQLAFDVTVGGGVFFGEPIAPGAYTIGAFGTGLDSVNLNGTVIADPSVSYDAAAVSSSVSLARPVPVAPSIGLFGPTAPASPEPGTVALLVSMGISGIVLKRRRTK